MGGTCGRWAGVWEIYKRPQRNIDYMNLSAQHIRIFWWKFCLQSNILGNMSLDTHQKSDMKPSAMRIFLFHLCFHLRREETAPRSAAHISARNKLFFFVMNAACSKRNLWDMNFSFHLDEIICNVFVCVCVFSKYGIRTLDLRSFNKFLLQYIAYWYFY